MSVIASCRSRMRSQLEGWALFATVLLLFTAGATVDILLTRVGNPTAAFWPFDGLVLGVLLCRVDRGVRSVVPVLGGVFCAIVAADMLTGHGIGLTLAYAVANLGELGVGLRLLRPLGRSPDLLARRAVAPMVRASLIGPALGALLAAAASGYPLRVAPIWFAAHALGVALGTPIATDTLRGRVAASFRRAVRRGARRHALALAAALAVVFGQSRYALLFLLSVPLVRVIATLGPGAATSAGLALACAACIATIADIGPFSLNPAVKPDERILLAQFVVLVTLGTLRVVGDILRDRGRAETARALENARLIESEARYRLLADNALDVVSRIDADGSRSYLSPSALAVFGVPAERLIRQDVLSLVFPPDRMAVAETRARLLAGFDTDAVVTFRVARPDGTLVWLEERWHTVPHDTDGAAGFVTIARDVTERQRLEEERVGRARALELSNHQLELVMRHLAAARDEAEQASRAKSRFLAGISHELRTPLNGILGHSEMLRLEGGLQPAQAARVDAMLAAGSHLLAMISAVLDLSTIEAGRMECRPDRLDVVAEARSCLTLLRPQAEAKQLGFELAADEASLYATADALRLRQVLLNLIGNAVKFTDAGHVTVSIGTAGSGAIRIAVADTGPGVDPSRRDRLFDEFDRLDIEEHRVVEGAGLGLPLSARLAKLMGGLVFHEDRPGGGSVFVLELPAAETAGPPLQCGLADRPAASTGSVPPAMPEQADVPSTTLPVASARRVLVVDDVAVNRDIASAFLRSGGHDAIPVGSAAEALDHLAREPFDIVLMDVRMPGMDGMEATRRIRAMESAAAHVPVVALTALAFADQVERCVAAGMDAHLAKPIRREALLDTVDRLTRDGTRDDPRVRTGGTAPRPPTRSRHQGASGRLPDATAPAQSATHAVRAADTVATGGAAGATGRGLAADLREAAARSGPTRVVALGYSEAREAHSPPDFDAAGSPPTLPAAGSPPDLPASASASASRVRRGGLATRVRARRVRRRRRLPRRRLPRILPFAAARPLRRARRLARRRGGRHFSRPGRAGARTRRQRRDPRPRRARSVRARRRAPGRGPGRRRRRRLARVGHRTRRVVRRAARSPVAIRWRRGRGGVATRRGLETLWIEPMSQPYG